MLRVILLAALASSAAAARLTGKYEVERQEVSVTRFGKTSPIALYYPKDYASDSAAAYPVVAFSHGKPAGASDKEPMKVSFTELLEEIASHGVVVIAPQTCLAPKCAKAFFDQLAAIDACRQNKKLHPVLRKANFNATSLVGHGLGGQHTERSARKIRFHIKAAVALHSMPRIQWSKQAMVPTLYVSGTLDTEAPSLAIKKAYDANPQPGSRFANLKGAGHMEPSQFGDKRLNRYVAHYVRCLSIDDVVACKEMEAMCTTHKFASCTVKQNKIVTEMTSIQKVQKSCPICMAYFLVLMAVLFCCFFPSCTNERFYGK
ncbi:hypothetical protein DIPPA_10303 [Diplonema papillatum]|nr:hypothetical protein DIPPA_10303 [Diplonema papillatum]